MTVEKALVREMGGVAVGDGAAATGEEAEAAEVREGGGGDCGAEDGGKLIRGCTGEMASLGRASPKALPVARLKGSGGGVPLDSWREWGRDPVDCVRAGGVEWARRMSDEELPTAGFETGVDVPEAAAAVAGVPGRGVGEEE